VVEGQSHCDYGFSGDIGIFQYVWGGYSEHLQAAANQKHVSRLIPQRPITTIMRFAIDFDRELRASAVKIQHIRADGMLAAKFQAVRITA